MANEWALLLFGSMLAAFALSSQQLSAPIVTGESSSKSHSFVCVLIGYFHVESIAIENHFWSSKYSKILRELTTTF